MSELIPKNIRGGADALALVGFEEGGPGQVHSWLAAASGLRVACFVNPGAEPPRIDIASERAKRDSHLFEFPLPDSFKGLPLLTSSRWCEVLVDQGVRQALVYLSDLRRAQAAIAEARAAKLTLVNAIHPSALVLPDARLADNIVLHARAFVGYRADLSPGVVLNTGAQVDHHNVIGECATLDPGVITAGNVTIGPRARLHTGAIVKNRIRIGADAVVGAGSVIIRDVPDATVVAGVPGRVLRRLES
ncbi:MAG: acetyltransferase [Proteobacteria bacterium]|nr:acetyltransferase [Pseudomonadota bacterium]